MRMSANLNRRDLMKVAAAGAAALALPIERAAFSKGIDNRMPVSKMPKPFTMPFRYPAELRPSGTGNITCWDGKVRSYPLVQVRQQLTVAEIMPGFKTPVFAYNGSTPGPTIRVRKGQPILVDQTNLLHRAPAAPFDKVRAPAPYTNDPMQRSTSTHLHGSASMPQFDGYASDTTFPNKTKRYFYPNSQEARTLWYHDHAVHHTSQNAYSGLAGMYILHDEHEQRLGVPQGKYDVPLVVRDAMFDTSGQLIYDDNSESGVYGDVILINGVPWPEMVVERRKYRFRILNASVSRSYTWQLHDGSSTVPMTVIGTDAGLTQPQKVTSIRHGMAERYEVVIDFTKYPDNALLTLKNLSPDNNEDFSTIMQAMRFRVRGDATSLANNLPDGWAAGLPKAECMTFTEASLKAMHAPTRRLEFERGGGQWTISEETWEEVIDSNYRHSIAQMERGKVEIWELTNNSGGWFHPVHIHLVDFQVLSRNGSAAKVKPFEKGPKDVVYVGENETVRVAMRFDGPAAGEGWPRTYGRYMMHCHNLVHEDHDMMTQFNVIDPAFDPFDPRTDPVQAARPVDL
jgi:spore coat protein A